MRKANNIEGTYQLLFARGELKDEPFKDEQSCNFKILVNLHEGLQDLNKVEGNQ